jgi:hypothetical protein
VLLLLPLLAPGVLRLGRHAVRGEEGQQVWFREVETEGFQGDFEFVVVDALVFIQVE